MVSALPDGSPPRSRWILPALLPLLVLAAFSPALFGGFQNWDDVALLLDNTAYRGLGWPNLRWMLTTSLMGHYMPVAWLTYSLDYVLWGGRPRGYHLTNIALHAVNVVLVYVVALRIFRRIWSRDDPNNAGDLRICGVLTAFAFGVHPLRAESVAWITERRDVLCGLFYLLAVLLYLRACEAGSGDGRRRTRLYWAALGAFVLALLSKSMAVTLPVILLVLDVYPLRRLRPGRHGWLAPGPGRIWGEKVPFLLAAAVVSVVAFWALLGGAAATAWGRLGLLDRLAISAYSVAFYLQKTLLPLALSPLYELYLPVPRLDGRFVSSGAVVALITLVAVALRRRWPGLLAAWACYVVMLLPVVGIFHNGYQIAADRYTYLPAVSLTVLAGGVIIKVSRQMRSTRTGRRTLALMAAVLVLPVSATLMLATREQVKIWQDDETLWRRAARLDPVSPIAASNLGSALRIQGRLDEAVEHSLRAIELRPDFPQAHLNLGLARAQQGRTTEAERHFRRVLEARPRSAPAHSGLASVLAAQGRLDEAVEHFRSSVTIGPTSARAHNDLGVALARSGRGGDALAEFSEAVRLDPSLAQAQNNLGLALAQTGRLNDAVDHFRAAIRSQPDFQEARQSLAHTLRLLGR